MLLNDQHDQNFTEKAVVHNLLHAFCRLFDSSYFLASKRRFIIIVKTSTFSSWLTCFCCFCCEIFADFYEVNIRMTFILLIIFTVYGWTLTGLKQLRFFLLSRHHFFFLKIMLKCDYQIWSSSFIVYWTFICWSLNHCIALHMFWSYKYPFKCHHTTTFYWRYRVTADVYMHFL